jgi:hypothetical protein
MVASQGQYIWTPDKRDCENRGLLEIFSWDFGFNLSCRIICDPNSSPSPSRSYLTLMKVKAVVTVSLTGDL